MSRFKHLFGRRSPTPHLVPKENFAGRFRHLRSCQLAEKRRSLSWVAVLPPKVRHPLPDGQ